MDEQYKTALYNQKKNLSLPQKKIERVIFETVEYYFHNDNRINIISGLRRTGKSTLIKQLMLKLENYIFINFDDDRLHSFETKNFDELNEIAIMVYGPSNYYFFDEIQNVPNFELFVRRLHDEGKKIVLTGSNSSMLSMELGTRLTGRYKSFDLYPFSFAEYLAFEDKEYKTENYYVTEEKVELIYYFSSWLENGGLPEYLLYKDQNYVKTLFDNIIYRDIVARYGIKRIQELQDLIHLLTSKLSLPVTYNSLKNAVELSNSDTVKEYISYLSNSWVFFELRRYANSLKQQLRAPRKIYMIDVAFNKLIGFNTSENLGRRLENAVYISLKSQSAELFYFQEKGECDFIVKTHNGETKLYQVCYELTNTNQDREIKGLMEAMNKFKISTGTILTFNQESMIKQDDKTIYVKQVWKWMLERG